MGLRDLSMTFLAICLCLPLLSAEAQVRDASLDELIAQLNDKEVQSRRDAVYELVRRDEKSESVIAALGKATSDDDTQVRVQSLTGLTRARKAAEPVIPELLKCLTNRDSQVRFRAAAALAAIGTPAVEPLMLHWANASNESRIAAAQAFAILGRRANPAIPLLTQGLSESSDLPRYAAEAIVAIAPQDEAALLKLADHADSTVRSVGIGALASLKSPSALAIERMKDAAGDSDPKIREATAFVVAKSSLADAEKAVLIEGALADPVPSVRAAAIFAMRRASLPADEFAQRIVPRLQSPDADVANAVVKALAALGPGARSALPELVEAAGKEGIDRRLVSQTFASFGPPVVPDLLAAIEEHPTSEAVFSEALGLIGQPAVDALTPGLSSDTELVRLAVTRALGGVRPQNLALLETLAGAVADKSPRVREVAINSLIAAGKEATFAKEVLLDATDDVEPNVRAAALHSLQSLQLTDQPAQATIDRGLSDAAPQVRAAALNVLSEMPKLLQSRADNVAAMASDVNVQVRINVAQTLGKLDKKQVTESLVSACTKVLADSDPNVKIAATESVRSLGISDPAVLKALSSNLTDDLNLLRATLEALAGFSEKAAPVIPAVSDLAAHEKAEVRAAALNTLAAIDKDQSQLAARLTSALDDQAWEVRRIAGVALGKLGPEAKNAVPKLFQLLSSEEDRDFASSSLKEINTAPIEAIPLLIEKLDSEDRRTSFYAVSLLGKIGPPAAEALPKLEAMLSKPSSDPGRSEFRRKFLSEAIATIKGEPPAGK